MNDVKEDTQRPSFEDQVESCHTLFGVALFTVIVGLVVFVPEAIGMSLSPTALVLCFFGALIVSTIAVDIMSRRGVSKAPSSAQ